MANEIHLNHFNQYLLLLSQQKFIDDGELKVTYRFITELLVKALNIGRASIWFYNEDKTSIISHDLFEQVNQNHSSGLELKEKDFPNYFKYLKEERTLPAHNALIDPSTAEFADVYLKPLNIFSMLDAPIRLNGVMIGVICNENLNHFRTWSSAEEIFVGNVCDIISRALQASQRVKALNELAQINQNLEQMILERTKELEKQIVERKKIEVQLVQNSKMVSLGEMSAGVAHEINNPLAIITGSIHLLKKNRLDDQKFEKSINEVDNACSRINKIVYGLKKFSRTTDKKVYQLHDLNLIIQESIILTEAKAKRHSTQVIFEPQGIHKIMCVEIEIEQVLVNLINNAIDAVQNLKDKWIKIEIFEESDGSANGNIININVIDSGDGIPDDIVAKLFDPFFTTKPVGEGTGLGLSISKGILDEHNAKIQATKYSGHTCFNIKFPKN